MIIVYSHHIQSFNLTPSMLTDLSSSIAGDRGCIKQLHPGRPGFIPPPLWGGGEFEIRGYPFRRRIRSPPLNMGGRVPPQPNRILFLRYGKKGYFKA